jgi:hypothetical protein
MFDHIAVALASAFVVVVISVSTSAYYLIVAHFSSQQVSSGAIFYLAITFFGFKNE